MTTVTASLAEAYSRCFSAGILDEALHPIYRRLLGEVAQDDNGSRKASPATSRTGGPRSERTAEDALMARHLSTSALLVLAVEGDGPLRRLRMGIHADGASIESSVGSGQPSLWQDLPPTELLERIRESLPQDGPLSAPPRLTVEQGQSPDVTDSGSERVGQVLRLSPDQMAEADRHVKGGADPRKAFADITGIDPLLRDALTATGLRASLSVVLQDPRRITQPSSWMRLWSVGDLGIYRTDTPDSPALQVVPVAPGDLLATALGLLQESFRFVAATTAGGRA